MGLLIDTNILLRSVQPTHPLCSVANQAVTSLMRQGETVFFCGQTVAEFWNVATRPLNVNGLGLSNAEARSEVENIEALLTVYEYQVQGIKVFDTRLAAVAATYGVDSILTFNPADFRRYGNLTVLDPASFSR
jgi:predicted nucleic acid-binding protein